MLGLLGLTALGVKYIDIHMIKAWYSYAQAHPIEVIPQFILLAALSVVCLCPAALVGMLAGAGAILLTY